MDNMKYYSGSLAHDFDMFMPKNTDKSQRDNIIELPKPTTTTQKRMKTQASVAALTDKAFAIVATAFVVIAVFASIYIRAEITTLNSKINSIKTEIGELGSEQVRLEVELERKISFNNIETQAQELGMQKAQRTQIVYIKTGEEKIGADISANVANLE